MIYVVKPNDTIDSIASLFNLSPNMITFDNQIPYPYELAIGETLFLNTETSVSNNYPVYAGGYAYPFISSYVLRETLPYLSYLYDFSYGFTPEGDLVVPLSDDSNLLDIASNFDTDSVLTLAPFGNDGKFNNNLISSITGNVTARRQLMNNIIEIMYSKGFTGLDIDFEYILPSDRDNFTEFVQYMAEAMHTNGFLLSVALAPKTSANQKGLLYEGKDYPSIGEAADYVLLMTYEWGYKYGPPLAVAPIPNVRTVLDYAVSVISPDKIHLGIPNYGYDWPLPYSKGITQAVTIGLVEAVQIAIKNNVAIEYDDISQAPYFTYKAQDEIEHIVWFEDLRSFQAKFDLVKEYKLRGITYWQIMRLFRAGYLLMKDNFTILFSK